MKKNLKNNDLVNEESLGKVISGIADIASDWLHNDDCYKTMVSTKSPNEAIYMAEHLMSIISLKLVDALREKGLKIDDERFHYIQGLCYNSSQLEKHIEKTEGYVCHVDKAYSRVYKYLNGGPKPEDGSLKETIVCSAIITPRNVIIRGHRHNDCIRTARSKPYITDDDVKNSTQGFITSKNRFVDRKEAHLIHCGVEGTLFSEDIY